MKALTTGEAKEEKRMGYIFPNVLGMASQKIRTRGVRTAMATHCPSTPRRLTKMAVARAVKAMLAVSLQTIMVTSRRLGFSRSLCTCSIKGNLSSRIRCR